MGRKNNTYRFLLNKRKRKNSESLLIARQAKIKKGPTINSVSESDITNPFPKGEEILCMDREHVANDKQEKTDGVLTVTSGEKSQNSNLIDNNANESTELFVVDTKSSSAIIQNFPIEGRRIIDFQYFWNQLLEMDKHSEKFNCKLNYLTIISEKQYGFKSSFHMKCSFCGSQFILESCKTEEQQLDVNVSTVSGAIVTGIGHSNLNEVAASMGLPTMPFRLYSKTHDAVSKMWKTAAEESMMSAAEEERSAAISRGDVSSTDVAMIAVQADACWSKRSYKNNYSALSGVAAIIGEHSGNVLHIGVRNKYCVVCSRASKKGEPAESHNCSKNHSGSSTSMEQAIIVEGFQKSITDRNLIYKTLIADGDSSTYKSILESRPYPQVTVQKIECTNHLLRNYNGKNLLLVKDTSIPLPERKLLTNDRLTRLRTAVRSAVRYRKDESNSDSAKIQNLQKDIANSPRHIFGDHTQCDAYYCTDDRKAEPDKTALAPTLMLKLLKNSSQLAFNSRSLLHCSTNNRAEQFNSIVAKMVGGKRVNFSLIFFNFLHF